MSDDAIEPAGESKLVPACKCEPVDPAYLDGKLCCGTCGKPYIPRGASPVSGCVPPEEYRWKPGQSGNPLGRPAAGASIREWLNIMADWSEQRIQKAVDDEASTAAKRAAARTWLHAISGTRNKVGTPISGDEVDRIVGHTDLKKIEPAALGGPATTVNLILVHTAPPPRPAEYIEPAEPAEGDKG